MANIYRAPGGSNQVSVNRLSVLSDIQCKEKALQIANTKFKGFVVIQAGVIRKNKSEVVDSRDGNYYGHADIIHPIILQKGEVAPPEFNQSLKNMLASSRYIQDPNPKSKSWEGMSLK